MSDLEKKKLDQQSLVLTTDLIFSFESGYELSLTELGIKRSHELAEFIAFTFC